MSVSTALNRVQINGSGAITPIAFNRKVFASSDIVGKKEVVATGVITTLVEGTDYSVTGAGNTSTGVTITPLVAPAVGERWTFFTEQTNTQGSVYVENDRFPAKTTEYALDKVTLGVQDNARIGSLSLRYPDTETIGTNNQLPAKAARASKALGFDANGEPSLLEPSTVAASDSASIDYNQGGIGAVDTTVKAKLQESVSVNDFGAIGDGVTDDTDAIQLAISNQQFLVGDPKKTYKVSSTLVIPYRSEKTVIKDLNLVTTSSISAVIENSINSTASTTLATAVRAGRSEITVTDASGMSDGDIIKIVSDRLWPYNNGGSITNGEVSRIAGISGNDVTLDTPLICDYNTAAETVTVTTRSPCRVDLGNITITQPVGGSGFGVGLTCDESTINCVTVKNSGSTGISLVDCFGVVVEKCHLLNNYVSGLGYGIQVNSSVHTTIANCHFFKNRRGVDFSGGIPSHYGTVIGCTAVGHPDEGSSFGTHGGANFITFVGNTLSEGPVGFQLRSPNTSVIGNIGYGVGTFIYQLGAPALTAIGNQLPLRSTDQTVGATDSVNAYFLEIVTTDGASNDLFTIADSLNNVSNNTGVVLNAVVRIGTGITELKQYKISGNNFAIRNNSSGTNTAFIEAVTACTSKVDSVTISDNQVKSLSGTFVKYRNFIPGVIHERGSGSPEASLSANIGSTFARTDGTKGRVNYQKVSGSSNTGWRVVSTVTATTSELEDVGDDINTDSKYEGASVFNTTTNKMVYAAGSAAADVWVDNSGTVHSPV